MGPIRQLLRMVHTPQAGLPNVGCGSFVFDTLDRYTCNQPTRFPTNCLSTAPKVSILSRNASLQCLDPPCAGPTSAGLACVGLPYVGSPRAGPSTACGVV